MDANDTVQTKVVSIKKLKKYQINQYSKVPHDPIPEESTSVPDSLETNADDKSVQKKPRDPGPDFVWIPMIPASSGSVKRGVTSSPHLAMGKSAIRSKLLNNYALRAGAQAPALPVMPHQQVESPGVINSDLAVQLPPVDSEHSTLDIRSEGTVPDENIDDLDDREALQDANDGTGRANEGDISTPTDVGDGAHNSRSYFFGLHDGNRQLRPTSPPVELEVKSSTVRSPYQLRIRKALNKLTPSLVTKKRAYRRRHKK